MICLWLCLSERLIVFPWFRVVLQNVNAIFVGRSSLFSIAFPRPGLVIIGLIMVLSRSRRAEQIGAPRHAGRFVKVGFWRICRLYGGVGFGTCWRVLL